MIGFFEPKNYNIDMMKNFLKFSVSKMAVMAVLVLMFTSCLKNEGNYQRFSTMFGSVVLNNGITMLRLDAGGTYVYADEYTKFNIGDRVVTNFKIDYDSQVSGANYYMATEVTASKFDKKSALDVNAVIADTLKDDKIQNVNLNFISEYGSQVLLTISASFYATNDYHKVDVAKYSIKNNSTNDTLKLEFRHNNLGDVAENKLNASLTSFDITPFLYDLQESKSRVVEIRYNLGTIRKSYITYTRSTSTN